jgi:hypothetical protein
VAFDPTQSLVKGGNPNVGEGLAQHPEVWQHGRRHGGCGTVEVTINARGSFVKPGKELVGGYDSKRRICIFICKNLVADSVNQADAVT